MRNLISDCFDETNDDNDSEDVAEISLPKFPGSTEEHSFKAMKYAKFNMEATTANLDWLITFVSPDIGSGDQHGRKPRLPRSEHPTNQSHALQASGDHVRRSVFL